MAHQANSQSLSQNGLAVYKAIIALLVLAMVLYIHSCSAVRAFQGFIGQNLQGFSKKCKYFVDHALELFLLGYLKVLFSVECHVSTLLITLGAKTLCGESLD